MADGDAKIDGEGTHGAYAITGGTITVSGNAAAEGISSYGAAASGADSLVEIGQTAESTGEGSNGAFDIDSGKVTVVGNATANGDYSCGTSAFACVSMIAPAGINRLGPHFDATCYQCVRRFITSITNDCI
jgi:hypothetical protein